ncbi:hypothetical protein ACIBCU_25830 [Streptomyces sp. NPDC051064]|uniref:hypothetical protein n=1 Tax=Streptomyces sp. NPDC051064 TaxID=3365641 RepID=UPI00379C89E3
MALPHLATHRRGGDRHSQNRGFTSFPVQLFKVMDRVDPARCSVGGHLSHDVFSTNMQVKRGENHHLMQFGPAVA